MLEHIIYQDKFVKNKYTKYYFAIIQSAMSKHRQKTKKSDPLYEYLEAHHILPQCVFPEYKSLKLHPWNCVLLTAKEHYICHLLLCKMAIETKDKIGLNNAFRQMNRVSATQERHSSRLYDIFKKAFSTKGRKNSIEFSENRRNYMTGRVWAYNKDGINKNFKSVDDIPSGWTRGKKDNLTKQSRDAMGSPSRKRKGSKYTEDQKFRAKQSRVQNGTDKVRTSTKEKMSKTKQERDILRPQCWVNKGGITEFIFVSDLPTYLVLGWSTGRGPKNTWTKKS